MYNETYSLSAVREKAKIASVDIGLTRQGTTLDLDAVDVLDNSTEIINEINIDRVFVILGSDLHGA